MAERDISEQAVYQVFTHPFIMIQAAETILVGYTDASRFLSLVIDQDRLITVWPASRKQRMMYKRRLGHEKDT